MAFNPYSNLLGWALFVLQQRKTWFTSITELLKCRARIQRLKDYLEAFSEELISVLRPERVNAANGPDLGIVRP